MQRQALQAQSTARGVGRHAPLGKFRNLGTVWWHLVRLFCIFGEQIELSNPEYFRAYFDITRENPRFFHRLVQTF